MLSKKSDKLFLKKPNQTIMISNGEITASQRKAYNVLLHTALHSLRIDETKTDFLISITEIEKKAGIQSTNNKRLKEDLENLMGIKVRCVKESDEWDVFVLLARIKKEGDYLRFELPSPIRESLIKNDYYTAIDLMIIRTLKSKYAIILYEIALRYNKVEIPKYTIDEFKKLTGTESYKNFNNLKKFCLKPAIEEINEKTDIKMSYKTFTTGRKVVEIKFQVTLKDQLIFDEMSETMENSQIDELISFKLSRKQAQAIVKKYPPEQIRRNIEFTRKKAENGEIRNIAGFLTDAVKGDYAKDYTPADEAQQELVTEAKKCWQKTKGTCQGVWNNYKDSKTQVCHWCKKFEDQRNGSAKSEKPADNPESLSALIPVKITPPVRKLVSKYHKSHGAEYVRESIESTNREITDKRKYKAVLEKNLEKQAKAKPEKSEKPESRYDQHKRIRNQLKTMPEKQIKELRKDCLKGLKPFMRKRLEKIPAEDIIEHPSFLDYCVENLR